MLSNATHAHGIQLTTHLHTCLVRSKQVPTLFRPKSRAAPSIAPAMRLCMHPFPDVPLTICLRIPYNDLKTPVPSFTCSPSQASAGCAASMPAACVGPVSAMKGAAVPSDPPASFTSQSPSRTPSISYHRQSHRFSLCRKPPSSPSSSLTPGKALQMAIDKTDFG